MERLINNYVFDFFNEERELLVKKISEEISLGENFFNKPFIINFYIIIYITQGTLAHNVNDTELTINQNEVMLICPLQMHTFYHHNNIDGYVIAFTENYLVSLMESSVVVNKFELLHNFSISNIVKLKDTTANSIDNIILLLQEELKSDSQKNHNNIIHPLLITFLFNIYRDVDDYYTSISKQREKNLVSKFKILILEEQSHLHNVNYYAEKLNTNTRTLQIATKKAYNKTPKEIINNYLIINAKLQLTKSDSQIKEIAYNLGFSDSATFSKFFKKNVSQSPLEYKKNANILN